jgi:hypothetical protein
VWGKSQIHGKCSAVLPLTEYFAAATDDSSFAGPMEIVDIATVLFAIWSRHQHFDVLADDLTGLILEQLFAGEVEHQHAAARVNQDDAVDRGFHHSAQPSRLGTLGAGFGFISQRFST